MTRKNKRGKIFFFSGPSGVGKGTLINHLREKHPHWLFPPSCTTRQPRPGEKDGETYYFITPQEFEKKITAGEFLEYAHVHGETYYGTLKEKILNPIKNGQIVIREFDVQGFSQAREILNREDYISIFIYPPDGLETLKKRITKRAPISQTELKKRLESAQKELNLADIYDYRINSVEGKLKQLFSDAEAIITQQIEISK